MKKIIVVGLGFMGVTHAKNILSRPDLELCGIVDSRDQNIFNGMNNLGNAGKLDLPDARLKKVPVFTSIPECIAKTRPEAAVICTPLFLHYEMVRQCLEMGLDVLVEKPFCPELEQGRELIGLSRNKKLILMVGHCIRFCPPWEFLAQCIRDERYGKLRLLSTSRIAGEPTWGVWQDPEIKKTCGGAVFDLLIHDIDFANYSLGKLASMKTLLNRDDYWELSLVYDGNDAAVSIKGGFLHRHSPFMAEYAATFDHGSVSLCSLHPETIHIGTDKGPETVAAPGDAYLEELIYFTDCIGTRRQPSKCLPEDSLSAIAICRKVRESVNCKRN